MQVNLYEYLAGNEYPGRGICIGKTPDGGKAM
ncbi:MAG: inosine monophosphate cyclohydrolase, partial [Syntrophaceae bacterium]|nr:inosine monophosphate cyclohydrolase [Syntrophaceae bacterium]